MVYIFGGMTEVYVFGGAERRVDEGFAFDSELEFDS